MAECLCNGHVVNSDVKGVVVEIEMLSSNFDNQSCWIEKKISPYYISKDKQKFHFKLAPPSSKIYSDVDGSSFLSTSHVDISIRKLLKKDSVLLPWKGLRSDSSYIEVHGEKKFIQAFDRYFPKGAIYEPFTQLLKGESITMDFFCLDEQTAKDAPPFHITKTSYPVVRCEISPAKKNYFGE